MNILHTLWKIAYQTVALLAVIVVGLISITGSITPESISTSFGTFTLTSNQAGIALFQKHKYSTYQVSPYYDYLMTFDQNSTPLLTPETDNNVLIVSGSIHPIQKVRDQIKSYIGIYPMIYHVTGDMNITYQAVTDARELKITKTIQGKATHNTQTVVSSLTYSRDDLIIDEHGNIYSDPPQTLIDFIQSYYGIRLTKKPTSITRSTETEATRLIIVNPNTPGVLTLNASTNQTFVINTQLNRIEIHEPAKVADATITTQMNISYSNDIGETL